MARPNVIYIGNCQAQAFQSLTGHLGLDVEVLLAPPVWAISKEEEAKLEDRIRKAHFVFCQRLAPDFPVSMLRAANLRALAPGKTIIWPNIYFDGYFPGIGYIYREDGKVEGPLRDYHFEWMHKSWEAGGSVEETARIATDASAWDQRPDVVEASILQLREREADVDVTISDYIVNRFRSQKLFYAMNHPYDALLSEMLRRLFQFAGLRFSSVGPESYPYTLNEIQIPALGVFKQRYRPSFHDVDIIKGAAVDPATCKSTAERLYSGFEELTGEFFRQYDRVFKGKNSEA